MRRRKVYDIEIQQYPLPPINNTKMTIDSINDIICTVSIYEIESVSINLLIGGNIYLYGHQSRQWAAIKSQILNK